MIAEDMNEGEHNNKIENIKSCDAVLVFLEREMRKQNNMNDMFNYLTTMTILASVRRDLAVGTKFDGNLSIPYIKYKMSPSELATKMMRDLGHEH